MTNQETVRAIIDRCRNDVTGTRVGVSFEVLQKELEALVWTVQDQERELCRLRERGRDPSGRWG